MKYSFWFIANNKFCQNVKCPRLSAQDVNAWSLYLFINLKEEFLWYCWFEFIYFRSRHSNRSLITTLGNKRMAFYHKNTVKQTRISRMKYNNQQIKSINNNDRYIILTRTEPPCETRQDEEIQTYSNVSAIQIKILCRQQNCWKETTKQEPTIDRHTFKQIQILLTDTLDRSLWFFINLIF